MSKTATIVLRNIKESDGWGELASELGLSDEVQDKHFEYGEYASIELVIDESLNVVGGKVLPLEEVPLENDQ